MWRFRFRALDPRRGMSGPPVLLVNTNQMKPPVTPIGLDYLADGLERRGYRASVLDLCFADDVGAAIRDGLQNVSPVVVGVTLRNTDDCYFPSQDFIVGRVKAIVDQIRSATDAPLVLGGVGFSIIPEPVLECCAVDFGIWGDGEEALPELVARLERGESASDIPGLVWFDGDVYRRNPARQADLHSWDRPRRCVVDNLRYFHEGGMGSFETKRGCNQRCLYCPEPVSRGRAVRLRTARSVADEMEALYDAGITHLHTCDSEFNLPPEHAEEVCREFIRRGLGEKMRWYTYLAPVPFSRALANLMKEAGCAGIDFGVDHGNGEMLRRLQRPFSEVDLASTTRICRDVGIPFMYDLLLGGPGETKATVSEAVGLMKRLGPSRVGVSAGVRIYPGTPLHQRVVREEGWEGNPNLRGCVEGNESLLRPIFYVASEVGEDLMRHLARCVAGDERFFAGSQEEAGENYNYNENTPLVRAIREGYRGAFWDILRRVRMNVPPP